MQWNWNKLNAIFLQFRILYLTLFDVTWSLFFIWDLRRISILFESPFKLQWIQQAISEISAPPKKGAFPCWNRNLFQTCTFNPDPAQSLELRPKPEQGGGGCKNRYKKQARKRKSENTQQRLKILKKYCDARLLYVKR